MLYNSSMEGQEYLNQISAAAKPKKQASDSRFSKSTLIIGGVVALVLLIAMIIFGAILGGNKDKEKNAGIALALHLKNTSEIIQDYQQYIRSSNLRSSSSSLMSITTDTNRNLINYLTEKYNYKEKDVDSNILEQATLEKDGLESELFEAKINGILDRIYAHKMAYEISSLMSEETRLMDLTKVEALDELLKTSFDSLNVLYENFNSFSETK